MEPSTSDPSPLPVVRLRLVVIAVLVAAAVFPPSAAGASDPPGPSILLVTVDTLRRDRLGAYGYELPTSPRIDALLAEGVRFTDAHTVEPLTSPALTSMLTGLPPHVHGASRNGLRMQPDLPSMPKALAARGWTTAAVVSNWTLRDRTSRLAEHFDDYLEVLTRRRWFGLFNGEATSEDVTKAATAWLEHHHRSTPDRPYLLWVHYVDPHAPYVFHREAATRLQIDSRNPTRSERYDTEVATVDGQIGRLADRARSLTDAADLLVVFAADHGESLGEHDYWGHGRHLYEPSLAIPLGATWPGVLEPRAVPWPATIQDIAATVLGLVGVEPTLGEVSVDWSSALLGGKPPSTGPICVQAHKGAVQAKHESDLARSKGLLEVGFLFGGRKEIYDVRDGAFMSFDLAKDPGELQNLNPPGARPSDGLMSCFGEISEGLGALDRLKVNRLDDETVEQLRALGYLE